MSSSDKTVQFPRKYDEGKVEARDILFVIYESLKEKGYHPINQIVGYLISGDPAYIPRHNNARNLIRKLERDELIEELLRTYLNEK